MLGKLSAQTAALAIEGMLLSPYGVIVCSYIAGGLLEKACARNYLTVLGQLHNPSEWVSTLGPLKFACERLLPKPRPDCILAFEYDEKTPGMWQITKEHFDLDVGWVLEGSPLEVQCIYQIKVVADISSLLNTAHHSIDDGQLSLKVPKGGEKGLIIYCPKNSLEELPANWIAQALDRPFLKAQGCMLTIFFGLKDAVLSLKLSDLQCLREARRALLKALELAKSSEGAVPTSVSSEVVHIIDFIVGMTHTQSLQDQAAKVHDLLLQCIKKVSESASEKEENKLLSEFLRRLREAAEALVGVQ